MFGLMYCFLIFLFLFIFFVIDANVVVDMLALLFLMFLICLFLIKSNSIFGFYTALVYFGGFFLLLMFCVVYQNKTYFSFSVFSSLFLLFVFSGGLMFFLFSIPCTMVLGMNSTMFSLVLAGIYLGVSLFLVFNVLS